MADRNSLELGIRDVSAPHASWQLTWQPLAHWAVTKPDACAAVCMGREVTWAALWAETCALARGLLALGAGRGTRVAYLGMARPEFYAIFMGANAAGAAWLGLSPKFTEPELAFMLADCQPTVLFAETEFAGQSLLPLVQALQARSPSIQHLIVLDGDADSALGYGRFVNDHAAGPNPLAPEAHVQPGDDALIMYTSGSTGKPKGVLHTHASILAYTHIQVRQFGFGSDSRTLLHFPINHVAADVEIGFASLYAGATTVMMPAFDPVESLRVIEREAVTVVGQIPAMFLLQAATPVFNDIDWSRVEAFIWAGSAAPRSLIEMLSQLAAPAGARLITGYGSTETCGFVTYTAPEDNIELLSSTVGRPAPGVELRIVNEAHQRVPTGTVGEVAIRGPMLMRGYLNRPEETALAIGPDGWYCSGDLGWLDEAGFLHLAGRLSEMFKTGGENVHPREIEDVLELHPEVRMAAVVGVPDPVYHEVGRAFVVLKPGAELDVDALRAHCRGLLANFKVPKIFTLRDSLPLLPNGKVNKKALAEGNV